MSLINTIAPSPIAGMKHARDAAGLAAIRDPDTSAVLWKRDSLESFQRWIAAVPAQCLPSMRAILKPEAIDEAVTQAADLSGLPRGPERSRLIGDIAALSAIFARIMDTTYLRLRLDVVTTNACRKFHQDMLTARLVCTYRGTGTQYGLCIDGNDPEQIFTAPGSSPILLRGSLWPTKDMPRLLHRSPPIEGTGETRLVLVLDPVSDPDDHA